MMMNTSIQEESIITRYGLGLLLSNIDSTLHSLRTSRDMMLFFSNIHDLMKILKQLAATVHSQRNQKIYSQLPSDLVLQVFKFLPTVQLRYVCKSWVVALKSPLAKPLWRRYYSENILPFYIHQEIDCQDTENHWYPARVIDYKYPRVKIHYYQWSERWDEWITEDSPRFALLGSSSRKSLPKMGGIDSKYIFPGANLWIWDMCSRKYYPTVIQKIEKKWNGKLYCLTHYNRDRSEWLNLDSVLLFLEPPERRENVGI